MLNLEQIHKPTTIASALKLLQQPDTVAFAGGTGLIAGNRRDVRTVVDLSELDLAYVRESNGTIAIGATTTLAELSQAQILRGIANGVIAQAAHRSASSILRNRGTLAGTLVTAPDSILAVTMLALDARVTIIGRETHSVPFADFLSTLDQLLKQALVTEITLLTKNRRASLQTVARTPRDQPIVSVCVATRFENDITADVRIALGGVEEHAVRAREAEKALEGKKLADTLIDNAAHLASENLSTRGDYRGSAKYRKAMASVLTRRAVRKAVMG